MLVLVLVLVRVRVPVPFHFLRSWRVVNDVTARERLPHLKLHVHPHPHCTRTSTRRTVRTLRTLRTPRTSLLLHCDDLEHPIIIRDRCVPAVAIARGDV